MPTKYQLSEHRLSDSHTSPESVNKFIPYFSCFYAGLGFHVFPLNGCEFRIDLYSEGHTLLKEVNDMLPIFSTFLSETDTSPFKRGTSTAD